MSEVATKRMDRAKAQLILKHPFFGSVALGLHFEEFPANKMPRGVKFPTMATDGRTIWWCTEFVEKLTLEQTMGVIVHEVMHVVLRHSLRVGARDHDKWNIATDLVINGNMITKKWGFKLPPEGVFHDQLPWSLFLKGVDASTINAEQCYNLLPDNAGGGGGGGNAPGWGNVLKPQNPDGSDLSPEQLSEMEANIEQQIATAEAVAKSIGNMPNGIDELIKKAQKPQVRWEDKFRRFLGGDKPEDYSFSRPNRHAFHTLRVILPGTKKVGAGRIVVGIDTSGSVSTRELQHFLGELNAIIEETAPEEIIVIKCSTQVTGVETYAAGETIPDIKCEDRGGTHVSPVFRYVEQNNLQPSHLVYLTDMEVGDFPRQAPPYPVLWVNSSGNGGVTPPWGEVARIFMR